jgi:RNA-directed DNA polymerase
MELKKEQIKYIKKAFANMQSKQDLLELMNYCKRIVYGKKSFPFLLSQLTYNANYGPAPAKYHQFNIRKKSGDLRVLHAPNPGLKSIQKCLNLVFQTVYEPIVHATGFIPGRSILTNAKAHVGKHYVYNLDLKDFFSSIDQARVWGRLKQQPFELSASPARQELANIIASLSSYPFDVERKDKDGEWKLIKKSVLPQGAPTSPVLSNIICQQLDYYLSRVARRFGLTYTRFADDISFSSMHNVYQRDGEFVNELNRIVLAQNFEIKASKTRLQKSDYRQLVTGIVVNKHPNVKPKYLKDIRMWLYLWKIYGYQKANKLFKTEYRRKTGNKPEFVAPLLNTLRGKLNFLKMVKGETDPAYQKLWSKFENLSDGLKKENGISAKEKTKPAEIITLQKISKPILHAPKELVSILKKFSVENSVLRYATHTWDAGKEEQRFDGYEDFIRKIKSEFDLIDNHFIKLSPMLRAKIVAFLFQKNINESKGWGTQRIKFGWSSPEIREALLLNPEIQPENILLPVQHQFVLKNANGITTIQRFKQVIDIFKNEIEIRDDSSALLDLILELHDRFLPELPILNLENLDDKSFYVDVDYLRKALELIFLGMSSQSEKYQMSYTMEETKEFYSLRILHHHSFCRGLSKDSEKFGLHRGDFSTIKNRLTNLCDWSIETEFAEGSYRVNFLSSDPGLASTEKTLEQPGFSHILKFYK